jgi:hypothetical protein
MDRPDKAWPNERTSEPPAGPTRCHVIRGQGTPTTHHTDGRNIEKRVTFIHEGRRPRACDETCLDSLPSPPAQHSGPQHQATKHTHLERRPQQPADRAERRPEKCPLPDVGRTCPRNVVQQGRFCVVSCQLGCRMPPQRSTVLSRCVECEGRVW